MQQYETVAIIGVGLIGGSIGLAIRRHDLAEEIVGIGRRASSLGKARRLGAVDRTTTDLARGVANAELVVVCTPVAQIVDLVRQAAQACRPGGLITDAGSTKVQIVAALDGAVNADVRFIGSHPLAGDHNTGPEFSRAELFENRTVVITPTRRSRSGDVRRLTRFWTRLGARVHTMSAAEHDRGLATTSHLPHLVAAALAAATPRAYSDLVASGWRDTTRVASGDPDLWQQIFMSNQPSVLRGLKRLEKELASLRTSLESKDARRLKQLLQRAKQTRDALGS